MGLLHLVIGSQSSIDYVAYPVFLLIYETTRFQLLKLCFAEKNKELSINQ